MKGRRIGVVRRVNNFDIANLLDRGVSIRNVLLAPDKSSDDVMDRIRCRSITWNILRQSNRLQLKERRNIKQNCKHQGWWGFRWKIEILQEICNVKIFLFVLVLSPSWIFCTLGVSKQWFLWKMYLITKTNKNVTHRLASFLIVLKKVLRFSESADRPNFVAPMALVFLAHSSAITLQTAPMAWMRWNVVS